MNNANETVKKETKKATSNLKSVEKKQNRFYSSIKYGITHFNYRKKKKKKI